MTPERLRDCLATLHWSQRGLAEILNAHPTTVRRWAAGTQDIPPGVAAWLDELADYARQRPYPEGWRQQAASSLSASA